MELKDLQSLYTQLNECDLNVPPALILSGTDLSLFDVLLARIKVLLGKGVGTVETILFSGEPGDDSAFLEEVFNIPLFAPYRLILVRRANEVFKPILGVPSLLSRYKTEFEKLPDRTWVVLQFEGAPPKKFLEIFGERLLHFPTKELYPNQVPETIRAIEKKLGLRLDEEAVYELKERVEPRSGSIEQALQRLKELLPPEKKGEATAEEVRDLLYPSLGLNPFHLVEALFEQDHHTVRKELLRYNPAVDSFFVIFKLMLNHTDEIRRARLGRSSGMNDGELVELLNLKSRPPFIQKKILRRLHDEIIRFDDRHLHFVYELLMGLQKDFRGNIPPERQRLIFEERILPVFFRPDEKG